MRLPWLLTAGLFALLSQVYEASSSTLECKDENLQLRARIHELESQLAASIELTDVSANTTIEGTDLDCDELVPFGTTLFYKMACMAAVCVTCAALAAGLTMGLVSIETMEMEMVVKADEKDMRTEQDKIQLKQDKLAAERVLPLLRDHHRLLVTLLLMNSIANEALPLFLDAIVPSWLAVILSVSLVLIFGEILPSAVFTGPQQLKIAAKFTGVVSLFQTLLAPIAVPIAKALDCVLGADHKGRYNFAEFRALLKIHSKVHDVVFDHHDNFEFGIITAKAQHHFTEETVVTFHLDGPDGKLKPSTKLVDDGRKYYVQPVPPPKGQNMYKSFKLYTGMEKREAELITYKGDELTAGVFRVADRDEIRIIDGVMNLTHMTVRASGKMVPLSKCAMVDYSRDLTLPNRKIIYEMNHSRLPAFQGYRHNVRGFLLVKKLIMVEGNKSVGDLEMHKLFAVHPDMPMFDLLRHFQTEKRHLALVTATPDIVNQAWAEDKEIPPEAHMMGIITLEDVIEKLVGDIDDECDADAAESNRQLRFALGARALTRGYTRTGASGDFEYGWNSRQTSERTIDERVQLNDLSSPLLAAHV